MRIEVAHQSCMPMVNSFGGWIELYNKLQKYMSRIILL